MQYKDCIVWGECEGEKGILIGADLSQEWLLPWWWENYRKANSHPLCFIDFGMSFESKSWCKERGKVIPLRVTNDFLTEKEAMEPAIVQKLEENFGKGFWESRAIWFKKPLACLKSPFQKTIWIDLDCEIKGPIDPLFEFSEDIALAKDLCDAPDPFPIYGAGVIGFRHGSKLLIEWAKGCVSQNGSFRSDQELISRWIGERKIPIQEIPPIYNWSRTLEEPPDTVIVHWHGAYGKWVLRNRIALSNL